VERAAGEDLEVVLTDRTFATEELSARSACLEPLSGPPRVALHSAEAIALGIADGDNIAVGRGTTTLEAAAKVCDHTSPGILVVPRDRRLPWQEIGARVRRTDIRKK
jgi:DNA-binding transcriptional regulator LsrR (DeoR family)